MGGYEVLGGYEVRGAPKILSKQDYLFTAVFGRVGLAKI